jgi:rhodanese-related sulfurtransferase
MKKPNGEIQRILLEVLVIFALGAVIGLSFNYRLVIEAFARSEQTMPAVAEEKTPLPDDRYPTAVFLAEAQKLLAEGALSVDARIPEMYREGHLPGAVSLPLSEVDAALPAFQRQVPAEKTLIVYCSGYGCSDSFDLGVILRRSGYADVRVFEGGLPQWQDAGLPVESGP